MEIVKTNDPLDLAETRDRFGDVDLDVHPVETRDDGLAQQHEAIFLATREAAAILPPPYRGNHRAGFVRQKPLEIRRFGQEIQPQLDEFGAALGGLLYLNLHHLMPCAADDDADIGGTRF